MDPKTGTALVRVALPANSGLRPGQFVTLRIVERGAQGPPGRAGRERREGREGGTVIALVEGDKAIQKPVKAGLRDGGLVEVEGDGLQAGMTVVTEGAYGLPKETKIRVLEQVNGWQPHGTPP